MSPKVSILIPTYNRAGYLHASIASALAQTYTNIEILILDDCSPDNTAQITAEYASNARVHYIRHEKNLGIVGNWKFGIEAASGDYFCLLHDDDTIEPDYVETLLQPLQEDNNLILSFCDHWQMNAQGQRLPEGTENMSKQFKRDILPSGKLLNFAQTALMDVSIPIGATLFRRIIVTPNFVAEEAKGSVDIWLLYQCVRTGHSAFYVSKRLMNYRAHDAGMSHSMPRYMLEGNLFRHRTILADHQLKQLHPLVRRQLAGTLTKLGITLVREGERQAARKPLRESLRYGLSSKILLTYVLSFGGQFGTCLSMKLQKH